MGGIKKAFKKVTNSVKNVIRNPVNPIKDPVGFVKHDVKANLDLAKVTAIEPTKAAIDDTISAVKAVRNIVAPNENAKAPDPSMVNAADVQAPTKEEGDAETGEETASQIKKNRATGKKALTVARNSGGGVNI